jgi:hypothetical protein
MKKLSLITVVVVFALSGMGCATAKLSTADLQSLKQQRPPEGKALVYVVRPTVIGGVVKFTTLCDDQVMGTTTGNQFLYVVLEPGMHHFESLAENKAKLSLQVEEGRTYFIKQKVQMGIVMARTDLELMDESEGRKSLQSLKLSKDCRAYEKSLIPLQ